MVFLGRNCIAFQWRVSRTTVPTISQDWHTRHVGGIVCLETCHFAHFAFTLKCDPIFTVQIILNLGVIVHNTFCLGRIY